MKDMKPLRDREIVFTAHTFCPLVAVAKQLKVIAASRWIFEARIVEKNKYLCKIKFNIVQLSRRRFSEEFVYLQNLVALENNRITDKSYQYQNGKKFVPVFEGISKEGFESREGSFAVRTLPDEYPERTFSATTTGLNGKNSHGRKIYNKLPDMSIIDRSIRPLVEALNKIPQLNTLYSCQGHHLFGPENPFVVFRMLRRFDMFALHQCIAESKTNFKWHLKVHVLPRETWVKLNWILSTTQRRTLLSSRKLDSDIITLARGIQTFT